MLASTQVNRRSVLTLWKDADLDNPILKGVQGNALVCNNHALCSLPGVGMDKSRSESKRQCSCLGVTAVPSDQWPTAIMNSVIGSGAPPNCGFNITGEPGRSAPQTLGSDWGM